MCPKWGTSGHIKTPHVPGPILINYLSTLHLDRVQQATISYNKIQQAKNPGSLENTQVTTRYSKIQQVDVEAHNPEVAGSSPVSATIRKVPNSLRIGCFLLLLCCFCSLFRLRIFTILTRIYQLFINTLAIMEPL